MRKVRKRRNASMIDDTSARTIGIPSHGGGYNFPRRSQHDPPGGRRGGHLFFSQKRAFVDVLSSFASKAFEEIDFWREREREREVQKQPWCDDDDDDFDDDAEEQRAAFVVARLLAFERFFFLFFLLFLYFNIKP